MTVVDMAMVIGIAIGFWLRWVWDRELIAVMRGRIDNLKGHVQELQPAFSFGRRAR